MNRSGSLRLAFLSAGMLWAAGVSMAAGTKPTFDVAARKEAQPWIWEAPKHLTVPEVKNSAWPRTPVDQFILHSLEEKGLAPAQPVDDRTWLRRVHFAITGLPPTLEDLREFLEDPHPGARERVVDRLLSSPHFGERWARHWMDLMRYAETRGHESDYAIANAWQYRDYLVRAFNDGVPFDQFLMEHLAGDLLPQPRLRPGTEVNESVLGTGWAFLGEENHSPVDIRQDGCDRLDNKVDVFTKTFLGLTVSCARCHDHKFDPIRTQDYYALTGFFEGSSFRQVRFEAMENNRRMAAQLQTLRATALPPLAAGMAEASKSALPQISAYLTAAGELIAAHPADPASALVERARRDSLDPERLKRWTDHLQAAATNRGQTLHLFASLAQSPAGKELTDFRIEDQSQPKTAHLRIIADFTEPDRQPWKVDGEAFGPSPLRPGDLVPGRSDTHPIARVMTYGAARRDPFWNRLAPEPGNENDSGKLAATSRSGCMLRTPSFVLGDGHLHYLIRGKTRVYAAVDAHLMVEGPLHGQLVQKFDTGSALEPQWVTHDLSAYAGHRTHLEFGPDGDSDLEVLMVVEQPERPARVSVSSSFHPPASVRSLTEFARSFEETAVEACAWLAQPSLVPTDAEVRDRILVAANWLVQNSDLLGVTPGEPLRQQAAAFLDAEKQIANQVQWTSHTAIAWLDGTGVDEHVLIRGKPGTKGPPAPRSLPVAFGDSHPITPLDSSGRYELGLQLADPQNPLVARVIVNRVWHHLLGRGIVPTVDNFGALGERPTHPELLDFLAWQFVHEDAWSVKRLIKRLVLTQTYSMSHRAADPRAEELDPANNLWHRVPVRRLEAEAIRDALLAVSGRLNPTLGGPPVPVYLNEFVVGRGRPEKSGPLDGDGRRSVYLAMRRNFLPPTLMTFDSPTPFSTVGKRNVTNVPAQSLALMNDPLFSEQARVWAERLMSELPDAEASDRIGWLFESAYGRPPLPSETAACLESLGELREFHPASANDVECWADLCHALLNANEFIYVM